MIYSNKRRLYLSGWFQKHHPVSYNIPIKFHKFLILYEMMCKVLNQEYDFSNLEGWANGPIFSSVWGDYSKDRYEFDKLALIELALKSLNINEEIAKKCAFIVDSISSDELIEIVHQLNIWKAKEDEIVSNTYRLSLDEKDFNEADQSLIMNLYNMYSVDLIDSSKVFQINEKYFVFNKDQYDLLTKEHKEILQELSLNKDLINPVFVEIDSDGGLLID